MYIFGSILIIIGAVAILDNLGFLPGGFWEFFWPALLIMLGVSFITKSRCKECRWKWFSRCEHCNGKKTG